MLANVRQLAAVAHGWDRRRGDGIRGFLRWAAAVAAGRTRETDAPVGGLLDEEGRPDPRGPVRMMTIHAAKGLEFPYVVLPKMGSGERKEDSKLLVVDGRAACALKVAGSGGEPGFEGPFDELLAVLGERSGLERRRKVHVAMTRAEEMLIISGQGDPATVAQPDEDEPVGGAPLRWLAPTLLGEQAEELLATGGDRVEVLVEEDGPGARLALTVCRPESASVLFGEEREIERPAVEGEPAARPQLPVRPLPAPPTVSYSELSRYSECPYRWYLERVAGLPQRENDGFTDDSGGARARGTVAHRLLEGLTFDAPEEIPGPDRVRAVAAAVEGARTDDRSVADQVRMVEQFVASGLWSRIAAAAEVERESDFSIEIDPGEASLPVLVGTVDVLAAEKEGTALVVDYKSDAVSPDEDLELMVEDRYSLQRDAYALAALCRGFGEVEVAYCFLAEPDEVVSATFTAADRPAIAGRLAAAARQLNDGSFPVSARPRTGLCTGCPGRPLENAPGLCSHSFAETSRKG
jgi:ATP-dependent exoDNAse (exonuclease V) beta subunit